MNNFVVKWHQIVLIIVHFVIDSIDLWREENRCGESKQRNKENESAVEKRNKKKSPCRKGERKNETIAKNWLFKRSCRCSYTRCLAITKKREKCIQSTIYKDIEPFFRCFAFICASSCKTFAYKYLWTLRLRLH